MLRWTKVAAVILALVVLAFVILGAIVAAAIWVSLIPLRVIARRQRKLDDTQALKRLLEGRT